jgi:hypothetical protein
MTDDTTETTSTDDQFLTDHNPAIFGQVGTGKTQQIGTELARRLADDAERGELIDPKGTKESGE